MQKELYKQKKMRTFVRFFKKRVEMGNFSSYDISLKSLAEGTHVFDYHLKNDFFEKFDSSELNKGDINARVAVRKTAQQIVVEFALQGTIAVPCNRCLDDVELPVDLNETVLVKFGKENPDDEDGILVVPADSEILNVAWFIFETLVLAIPIQHVHADGHCNAEMEKILHQHQVVANALNDQNEEKEIDPRWAALRNINN